MNIYIYMRCGFPKCIPKSPRMGRGGGITIDAGRGKRDSPGPWPPTVCGGRAGGGAKVGITLMW